MVQYALYWISDKKKFMFFYLIIGFFLMVLCFLRDMRSNRVDFWEMVE